MSEINVSALKERISVHLNDQCLSLEPFVRASHHMVSGTVMSTVYNALTLGISYNQTYTAMTTEHGRLIVRVQWSMFKSPGKGCGIVSAQTMLSEVATMRYVKTKTSIPVPGVLIHDLDADHVVGGEWIIMEYIDGVPVSEAWIDLTGHERQLVCLAMADVWSQLMELRFDSIGSLYQTTDDRYHVGALAFLPTSLGAATAPPDPKKCGPFFRIQEWVSAIAHRDLDYLSLSPVAPRCLASQKAIIEELSSSDILPDAESAAASVFGLEHVDFSPHNILIDRNDPTHIMGVLDWEGARTVPMWAMNPSFQWPSASFSYDPAHEPENRCLKVTLRERIISQVPLWQSAIGEECRVLRNLHYKAVNSILEPELLPMLREPYLCMSYDFNREGIDL